MTASWSMIILAAGKGSRMGGSIPKPLVELAGKPLIQPILEKALELDLDRIIVVISDYTKEVAERFPNKSYQYLNVEPQGTGHAVLSALSKIRTENVIIAQADDSYFYTLVTLKNLMNYHQSSQADFVLCSTRAKENLKYSYIESDKDGNLVRLIDPLIKLEASDSKQINAGLYTAKTDWLGVSLSLVKPSSNGEIGLPFVVHTKLATQSHIKVFPLPLGQWQGVNTPAELAAAQSQIEAKLLTKR